MKGMILRFKGGKSKAFTISYDDGCKADERLISLMKSYNVKGTFNLVGSWQVNKDLYTDFEVAAHGFDHCLLDNCHGTILALQILKDRQKLEKDFDRIIRGFAYPGGGYSAEAEQMLKSLGICYSRTTGSSGNFEIPQNWLRWNMTCHHNNPKLFDFADRFLNETEKGIPNLFSVWGHSYEFDDSDNWNVIEKLFETVANKSNVWYASCIDIYDYCMAYNSLKFSTNGKIVYNPSATEVWFMLDEVLHSVKPNETIHCR